MRFLESFYSSWTWRMAWRDSRSSRRRLLLFTSSIVLGVAALVAISSFGVNLEEAIDEQARTLLGADLELRSRQPFSPETEALIATLGQSRSRRTDFSTMAYFPESRDLRLVQVRALEGGFPYYGILVTEPPEAAATYQEGPWALVDDALMHQFGARVGDPLRLGEFTFRIAGRLKSIPGESLVVSLTAPRVFIPLRYVEQTGLIQVGSRVGYRASFLFSPGTNIQEVVDGLEPHLEKHQLRYDTVDQRKRRLGRSMENLYRFLNLVGFVALLLGAIGIASAIHVYIKQKRSTVAILRCLGSSSAQTLAIYLLQAVALGTLGALLGGVLGLGVQYFLPKVLGDFLPLTISFSISPSAILTGGGIGFGITLLFGLLPLLPVRNISPLVALRAEYEQEHPRRIDRLQGLVYLLIAAAICGFAISQSERWYFGLYFFLGLAVAFGLLAAVAKLIALGVRKMFPASWSYVWRQGLANLYRPQNQTVVLMLSLGLGTFLIVTLYLVQGILLNQAMLTGSGMRPNLVFFDVQSHQEGEIRELLSAAGAPVLQSVPIVTMRLSSVEGRSVQEIQEDDERTRSRWALNREYRSTYRDTLSDTEQITAGTWVGQADTASEWVPISLEEEIADELAVAVGSELVFDVQGTSIKTRVGSIRRVDWARVQPNFFAVFPTGVLEEAPQFHVLVTRAETNQRSAELQRAVIEKFPNVSAIDLALIVNTIDAILDRVSFVIRFMAMFSFFTGLTVLSSAVITSRYQRMKESVLLRTLGASRRQIIRIMLVEYLLLGTLAAFTGLVLALAATWALAYFVFELTFVPSPVPIALAFLLVVGLTLLIGTLNSRGAVDRPPLEVLRQET